MLGTSFITDHIKNWDLITPEKRKEAYQTVQTPKVSYAAQSEGLTPTRTHTLADKIQVLKANQELFKGWGEVNTPKDASLRSFLNAGDSGPAAELPPQIASEDVQVADAGANTFSKAPEARVQVGEDGNLEGDQSLIQAFMAAYQTNEAFEQGLGRDIDYRGDQDGRLTVQVNDPTAMPSMFGGGPHYKIGQGIISTSSSSALDPDVINHETGHALLDSQRPQYDHRDSRTPSAHEAFADGTAMLMALQDKDVRADVLARRKEGQDSNIASTMAESLAAEDPDVKTGDRTGIRDASQMTEKSPEKDDEECHDSSRRFTHGLYQSVLAVEADLRRQNPGMSEDEALAQAAQRVQADFTRSVDFLPSGNQATQSDLAQAMIKANRIDGGGDLAATYRTSFNEAQVPVADSAEAMQEFKNQLISILPGSRASSGMRNSEDAVRSSVGPQEKGISAADQWLDRNASLLGVKDQDLVAQQIYHNDKGETWVEFSNGQGLDGDDTTNAMRVGFNANGRMIHADADAYVKEEAPPQRPA